jgi:hypothetical protein
MAKHSVAGTVADPTIEFAELKLNGKIYRLSYSFNSIAEAEHVAGCNLLAGLESLLDLTALQAAMSVADPEVTIEQAGSLVRLDTIEPITEALAKAYRVSMPAKRADPPAASAPAES